jgi:hypothetical protein
MRTRLTVAAVIIAAVAVGPSRAMAQSWSFPGLSTADFAAI